MGKDVLSPVEAWLVYDEWRTDDRVIFLPERAEFGEEWRQLGEINRQTGVVLFRKVTTSV